MVTWCLFATIGVGFLIFVGQQLSFLYLLLSIFVIFGELGSYMLTALINPGVASRPIPPEGPSEEDVQKSTYQNNQG
jgi:hypothetical protein